MRLFEQLLLPLKNLKKVSAPNFILVGIASGLYPFIYNYYSNFTLVDSKSQLLFFLGYFLLLPVFVSLIVWLLSKQIAVVKNHYVLLLAIINTSWFSYLIVISAFGFQKKILFVALCIAFALAFFLYRFLKKIVIFQLLLAAIVSVQLLFQCINDINFSSEWKELPDTIVQAKFVEKPNIYIIQPDGYANLSVLKEAPYSYDNSLFEQFLTKEKFKLYPNFRSNYTNTVTSNSALFAMKHHYYKSPGPNTKEPEGLRRSIASNNAVLSTLKNNGYRTSLLLEAPYLIINRPEIAYDYCSIPYDELNYLSRGFDKAIDIYSETEKALQRYPDTPNLFFIEKMLPRHISVQAAQSKGMEMERELYLKNLSRTNTWLKKIVRLINEKDPNGLIVIIADHGGFVGMNYTAERRKKTDDSKIIKSMYASLLAIKWPNNKAPNFDTALKTNTNLFRILFSHLSQDESYLQHLEDDGSYVIINEGAPFGVYKVLNDAGEMVFEKK
ncbi:sulfatase-like hydrolase/transferase [Patiriisocius sp. Uisw_017]|jgi:hypothetical protein|uniref:sulfatase-like hydrolase/transferase n=1 Tax=Patiriisocius sp. Uisw_017 TaxID=3230968 RepID=UPI0039EBAC8A